MYFWSFHSVFSPILSHYQCSLGQAYRQYSPASFHRRLQLQAILHLKILLRNHELCTSAEWKTSFISFFEFKKKKNQSFIPYSKNMLPIHPVKRMHSEMGGDKVANIFIVCKHCLVDPQRGLGRLGKKPIPTLLYDKSWNKYDIICVYLKAPHNIIRISWIGI